MELDIAELSVVKYSAQYEAQNCTRNQHLTYNRRLYKSYKLGEKLLLYSVSILQAFFK